MQRYCLDCGKPIVRYDAKRCRSCSKKGKLSVNFGRKFSKEHRQNMSKHHSNVKGENNPN
jgi:predicted amidophosphoribosyltransferase